jgi:hypothetical protein
VVARSVIAHRQSAVLLQLGRRLVLVGVSGDRMERLCEITDADEVLGLLSEVRGVEARSDVFEAVLGHEASTFREPDAPTRPEASTRSVGGNSTPATVTRLLTRLRALQRL